MVEFTELDWIVQKATEILVDKVKDAQISDNDIKIAFDLFAKSRLEHLSSSFGSELERTQARDFIMMKLQERAKQLNSEYWRKTE